MKIALLGYGKMGQVIEKNCKERGHEIVLKKTRTTLTKDYQPQM
jgi:4-hydroxy-tetrahydrodipicolinate reductase